MKNKIVTIFGGSGFIGRYLVKELAEKGYLVRVICRNPDIALHLKTWGSVGQVVLQQGNVKNPESIANAVKDSYAVVNLVGLLFEKGSQNFAAIHSQAAERIAKAAKAAGVQRFIHVSSLGVDKSPKSKYARTKSTGEKAVIGSFQEATILRPSLVFGYEDSFFNLFARMASYSPFIPLVGGGKTKFQPIYVGDVAKAIARSIEDDETKGRVYELGGKTVYTFKELIEYILSETQRHCHLINIPFSIAAVIGTFAELTPKPVITSDQVLLLEQDNVAGDKTPGLAELGITPTSLESIAPAYLQQYRKYGSALSLAA